MRDAFICDGVRTPIGRYGGALSSLRPDDLAVLPLKALMERQPQLNWSLTDDIILGCANQAGEDNRNVARMAGLLAGLPLSVSGTTINRLCGSGLDAIALAARSIKSGEANLMIAGGVESMSRAPFVMSKAESAFSRQPQLFDTTIGWRFINPLMEQQFATDSMPETEMCIRDSFNTSSLKFKPPAAVASDNRQVSLQLDGRTLTITMDSQDDSILDAALRQGADLPYACKGGVCATCKCKLRSGEVEMGVNYSLEPDQIAEGYILSCQSWPKGDGVVLDFDV